MFSPFTTDGLTVQSVKIERENLGSCILQNLAAYCTCGLGC